MSEKSFKGLAKRNKVLCYDKINTRWTATSVCGWIGHFYWTVLRKRN